MMCLLLSGATDVGKTTAVYAVKDYLVNIRHFTIVNIDPSNPIKPEDFNAILEGKNKNGKTIHIGLMAGLDTKAKMKNALAFFQQYQINCDFYVATIRDDFEPNNPNNDRKVFQQILGNLVGKERIEIPMGKVRRGNDRPQALIWYNEKIDLLCRQFLP